MIEAYGNAGNKTALVAIVKSRTEVADNKRTALNRLQNLAAPAELMSDLPERSRIRSFESRS